MVPCFNEAQRLDMDAFADLVRRTDHLFLVFVDDGSSDDTWSILRGFSEESPERIFVERLPENCGKGEAVRLGMRRAMELGSELIGYWDADLATPLSEVFEFQRVLERDESLQGVLGCRIPLLGHQVDRHPLRAVLGRIFAAAASVVLGVPVRDTQCGAKLFRGTRELAAALEQPFASRWIFDVELLARLAAIHSSASSSGKSAGIYELPLSQWSEKAGSKVRIGHFFKAAGDLIGISIAYSGSRRALYRQKFEEGLERELGSILLEPIDAENSPSSLPKKAA